MLWSRVWPSPRLCAMIQDKQGLLYHACRVHVCTCSACECICLPPLPPLPGALGCLQARALPGTLSPLYAVRRGCGSLAVNGACLALCCLAPSVAPAAAVRVAFCHVPGTPPRSLQNKGKPQTGCGSLFSLSPPAGLFLARIKKFFADFGKDLKKSRILLPGSFCYSHL